MKGGVHFAILLGYVIWLARGLSDATTVIINSSKGKDTLQCGGILTPCQSLNHAIAHWAPNHTNITFLIRNGSYTYSLDGSDSSYQFRSCDQVNITGEDNVIVNCTSSGAGFAFLNCKNIAITNVLFDHCGALQPGTSTNGSAANETIPVSTALYFSFCHTVNLFGIHVYHSNTSAVVVFNTKFLSVVESHFYNNSITDHTRQLSNAAFYVEFCYCDPGVARDNCTPHDNTGARYIFNSSYFTWNNVLNIDNNYERTFYIPYKNDYFSFHTKMIISHLVVVEGCLLCSKEMHRTIILLWTHVTCTVT